MASNKRLLMLPGDGIGPEVMLQVRRLVDWLDRRRSVAFDIEEDLVGGATVDALHKAYASGTASTTNNLPQPPATS